MSISKNLLFNTNKFGLISLFIFSIILTWSIFTPYYYKREINYRKHRDFLNLGLCDGTIEKIVAHKDYEKSEKLKKIGFDLLTIEGIKTNCSISKVYCSTPITVGAFEDLWLDSTLRTILVADDWRLKAIYGLTFFVGVIVMCYTFVNRSVQLKFLSTLFPNNNSNTSEVRINSRDRPGKTKRVAIISQQKSSHNNENNNFYDYDNSEWNFDDNNIENKTQW